MGLAVQLLIHEFVWTWAPAGKSANELTDSAAAARTGRRRRPMKIIRGLRGPAALALREKKVLPHISNPQRDIVPVGRDHWAAIPGIETIAAIQRAIR
jgi:hypothetical protein